MINMAGTGARHPFPCFWNAPSDITEVVKQTGTSCNSGSANRAYLPKFWKAEVKQWPHFCWHLHLLAAVLAEISVSSNYPPCCWEATSDTSIGLVTKRAMAIELEQAAIEVASWNGTESVYATARVGKLFKGQITNILPCGFCCHWSVEANIHNR